MTILGDATTILSGEIAPKENTHEFWENLNFNLNKQLNPPPLEKKYQRIVKCVITYSFNNYNYNVFVFLTSTLTLGT